MNQKDLKELKRYFSEKNGNIYTVYGVYVNEDRQIVSAFTQDLMSNLPEELRSAILSLLRKTFSGKLGSTVIPVSIEYGDENQQLAETLIRTNLKEEASRKALFEKICGNLSMETGYVVLLAVNSFDIIHKSSDDLFTDSDTEFSGVLCTICPVRKPAKNPLYYSLSSEGVYEQMPELYLAAPSFGFLYPSYESGSANVSEVLYYTKDTKVLDETLMQALFTPKEHPIAPDTQRTEFNTAVAEALGEECDTNTVLMIHDSIREWSKEIEQSAEDDSVVCTDEVAVVLRESGVEEECVDRFCEVMKESSGNERTLAPVNLVPRKDTYETPYVKISISPEYREQVRTDVINGRKCIIVYADEGVSVNGVNVSFPEMAADTAAADSILDERDSDIV